MLFSRSRSQKAMLMVESVCSFVTLYIKVSYNARGYRVRIFKTKYFAKFAEKNDIDDEMLIEAVERAEQGLIDANLGANVIKQRVARKGCGRSGGYRTLILYKINGNHFFVYGFAKNQQENISSRDLADLKRLAMIFSEYSLEKLNYSVKMGKLVEI